jgi:hypothetical protein
MPAISTTLMPLSGPIALPPLLPSGDPDLTAGIPHVRKLLRQVYDLRRPGHLRITASQLQVLVKSRMVMDVEEHTALLADYLALVAYAGCSTGQQWDEISYRVFNKKLPFFKVSYPLLWGNKPDAGYLRGQELEDASQYVAK